MLKPLNNTQAIIHQVSIATRDAGLNRDPLAREVAVALTAAMVLQSLHEKTGLTGRALVAQAVREIEAGHVYA